MRVWMLLLAAIACEVIATLSLKGALHHRALYLPVALGYSAAVVLLSAVLRRGLPLGVAYGIWAALGVAATAALSALIFAEPLTPVMGVGLALVILGVIVVEIGSHPPAEGQQQEAGA